MRQSITNPLECISPKYADNFRTFKHGVLHGVIAALFFFLPTYARWPYMREEDLNNINVGYWAVSGIMGGLISQFK
jgi:hypothetical protein